MRQMIMGALAVVLAFGLASCESSLAPAGPNPVLLQKAQRDTVTHQQETIYNSCCDEWVHLSYDVQVIYNKNGVHILLNHLEGIGDSGDVYKGGALTDNSEWHANDNNAGYVYNYTRRNKLVSNTGCMFYQVYRAHYTVDANGVVRVDRSESTIECFGWE